MAGLVAASDVHLEGISASMKLRPEIFYASLSVSIQILDVLCLAFCAQHDFEICSYCSVCQ